MTIAPAPHPPAAPLRGGHARAPRQRVLPPAGVGARVVAYLIDVTVIAGATAAVWYLTQSLLLAALVAAELVIGFVVWEGHAGCTPGQLALGLRTVRAGTPESAGVRRALPRALVFGAAHLLVIGPLVLVLTAAAGGPARQAWHDRIGGLQVVDARRAVRERRPAATTGAPQRTPALPHSFGYVAGRAGAHPGRPGAPGSVGAQPHPRQPAPGMPTPPAASPYAAAAQRPSAPAAHLPRVVAPGAQQSAPGAAGAPGAANSERRAGAAEGAASPRLRGSAGPHEPSQLRRDAPPIDVQGRSSSEAQPLESSPRPPQAAAPPQSHDAPSRRRRRDQHHPDAGATLHTASELPRRIPADATSMPAAALPQDDPAQVHEAPEIPMHTQLPSEFTRGARRAAAGPAPRMASGPLPAFRLDDGAVVPVDRPGYIGRRPSAPDGLMPDALLVTVPDPDRSLSRTHGRFGVKDGRIWFEDLGSGNGSALTLPDGRSGKLTPHQRITLAPGTRLHLGARIIEIVDA